MNTRGPSNERCSDRFSPEDAAQSEVQAESLTEVDCTETVDDITFTPDNECENSGSDDEAEDMPEVDTQLSDSETDDVWRYYDLDSDNFDASADKTTCESHDMSGTLSENHECISGYAASVLYEGSSLTVAASSIMMMNLKMKHNLTDTCMEDILKLIKFHCPTPNNCVRSVYLLKKNFKESKYPVIYHYYCDKCYTEVCSTDSECPNACCQQSMAPSEGRSSFIEVPVENQLKNLLGRKTLTYYILSMCVYYNYIGKGMCELIRDRASFLRSSMGGQESDICSGKLYQELCSKGIMQENCIALIVNVDGVPVFKSSGYQFWPIFIMICELPYRMRYVSTMWVLVELEKFFMLLGPLVP